MTNPNYAKFSTDAIKHRYDFLLLFDVTNGNPNGDPDAGNMPRQDVGSGKGFVTPMCIKRKIRNAVSEIMDGFKDEDKAYDIYISQDAPLRNKDALACEYVGVEPDKLADAKKNDPDLSDKLRNFMCANFYDVRTCAVPCSCPTAPAWTPWSLWKSPSAVRPSPSPRTPIRRPTSWPGRG